VREGAERAIATDAEEDLAYHMLGRWHNEIASINWAIKLAIDLFYGGLGESGSHQHAKRLFDKAIEINPTRMVHHVEMGRTYIKMGEHQKARQCLEYAMQLEVP
jgi:Tfp pilus assembly protein PilF